MFFALFPCRKKCGVRRDSESKGAPDLQLMDAVLQRQVPAIQELLLQGPQTLEEIVEVILLIVEQDSGCASATDHDKSVRKGEEFVEVIQLIPKEMVVCWCSHCFRHRNKLWKFVCIPQERVQQHRGIDRGVPVPQIMAKCGGDPACTLLLWSRSWPCQCHGS